MCSTCFHAVRMSKIEHHEPLGLRLAQLMGGSSPAFGDDALWQAMQFWRKKGSTPGMAGAAGAGPEDRIAVSENSIQADAGYKRRAACLV